MFIGEQTMKKSILDVLENSITAIVNGVNAGKCPEYKQAQFFKKYPAMLCLWPTDGGKPIGISAVEQMAKYVNGYEIDYHDRDTAIKHITITLTE